MNFMSFYYSFSRLRHKLFLKNFELLYQNSRINPPLFVVWESTKRCNLKCVHCSSHGAAGKELNTKEIKEIIDQLASSDVKNFQVTGGEPLLRKDLLEVLKYANKKGLKTSFASNGYYIDESYAKAFSDAGVFLIQISVDGTKDIHNKIRNNQKSFDKAINAIKLLKKYSNAKVVVSTTVMPQNIGLLDNLKDILIFFNIDFWNIGIVMPVGRAKNNHTLFLSKKQFNSLIEFVIEAKKEINVDVGENFPYLGKFDRKIRKNPKICPVGILYCCIGSDGHVRGCPDQPDNEIYREGDVRKEKFEKIWKRGFKKYRERKILKEDKKCSVCNHAKECFGGCWVMRENNMNCILDYLK